MNGNDIPQIARLANAVMNAAMFAAMFAGENTAMANNPQFDLPMASKS